MADEPVFIFPATYHTEADAQLDYAAVKELHSAGVIGTYDAAVVTKDADGQVNVHKREKPKNRDYRREHRHKPVVGKTSG